MPRAANGQVFEHVGKYARQAVMYAFQQMGGEDGLTDWAKENKDEFYTKLFPKIIAKESEVTHKRDIDSLMDVIDGEYEVEEAETADSTPDLPDLASEHEVLSPYDGMTEFDVDDMVEFEDD